MTESPSTSGAILTLAIMAIGLAIIVGGTGFVAALFAPLIRVVRKILGAIIAALLFAWLLLTVLSGAQKSIQDGRSNPGSQQAERNWQAKELRNVGNTW